MNDQIHDVYTGSDRFDIVVNHFGDARGIKNQFANSNPHAIGSIIDENTSAANFAGNTVTGELQAIKAQLQACWQGQNADSAVGVLDTLTTDAGTIASNADAVGKALTTFQGKWFDLRQRAMNLDTGVLGTGLGEDNSGAHQVYQEFNDAMNSGMHSMPSRLEYHTPLSGQTAGPGPDIPPGGSPGGGPAIPSGMGSGGGLAPGATGPGGMNVGQTPTGMEHTSPATFSGGGGGYRPGAGNPSGLDPKVNPGGNVGSSGGADPAGPGGGANLSPGSAAGAGGGNYVPQGGGSTLGPGADPTTTLSGYHPGSMSGGGVGGAAGGAAGVGGVGGVGPGGGLGGGIAGFGAPGLAGGVQDATRTSGVGSSLFADAGALGSAEAAGAVGALGSAEAAGGAGALGSAEAAGAAGRPGAMMPMRGGGGGKGEEEERERTTWLAEDEDVWSGDDLPATVQGRTGVTMPMRAGAAGDDDERERTTWLADRDDPWSSSDAPPGVIT